MAKTDAEKEEIKFGVWLKEGATPGEVKTLLKLPSTNLRAEGKEFDTYMNYVSYYAKYAKRKTDGASINFHLTPKDV